MVTVCVSGDGTVSVLMVTVYVSGDVSSDGSISISGGCRL